MPEDVAVVGIGCRFPPDLADPQAYWSFLMSRGDAVGEVPADRWHWPAFYDEDVAKPAKMPVRHGAFLRQPIEDLDASFFEVSPREAGQLDPQLRLLLEVSWEALEDARLSPWSLRGSPTGVFVGAFTLDNLIQRSEPGALEDIGPQTALTAAHTVLASRLSYFYDLRGPSFAVDTACSSSLVAIHEAARALQADDCEVALAGGVNRIFRPEMMLMMAKGQFLALDGRSKSFSANADGYGRGEGCGLVVLKRLDDARRDGDRVYAVVEGTGVNQDGLTAGPASPSSAAQAQLIRKVMGQAGVDPGRVHYVEAHGTGTPVGDPAEMQAIGEVLGQARSRQEPCVVGSVKAGIGHLEGAAGVAGFIKAALVAYHGLVPPQAWLDELNPAIDFVDLGLRVATEAVALPAGEEPWRVAINSFGYGGTNSHVVLRQPPAATPTGGRAAVGVHGFFPPVVVLSGHTAGALEAMASGYATMLSGDDGGGRAEQLAAFAGRAAHEHRRVVGGDPEGFVERLEDIGTGTQHPDVLSGRATGNRVVAPVFVLSGMGPQWWAMGRGLLEGHAMFREHAERCDEIFRRLAGWSILDEMLADEGSSHMARTEVAQPANFVLQTGLAVALAEVGVEPAAVVGHSVGEVAAAHIAGCYSLEDAITVAFHRSRLQATTGGSGAMLATDLSEEAAREVILPFEPRVSVAAVNAVNATTIAGDPVALDQIEDRLRAEGAFSRRLRVEVAYHSPAMDPILDELRASLSHIGSKPGRIPLYSTVDASFDCGGWDADYWVANVRQAVRFEPALSRLVADGHKTFLEVGPHPALALYLHQHTASVPRSAVVSTLHRDQPDQDALTGSIGRLWTLGVPVTWRAVLGGDRSCSVPAYPWQRERHWQESDGVRRARTGEPSHSDVLHGRIVTGAPPTWDLDVAPALIPWCRQHRVAREAILPAAAFLEAVVTHARAERGGRLPVVVDDLRIQRPLVLGHHDAVLRLIRGEDGHVALLSRQRGETESWRAHATARIGRGGYAPPLSAPAVDRASLTEVDVEGLYERMEAIGLEYQGPFRALRRARSSRRQVIAEAAHDGARPGYTTFPPLLDAAAFQVAFATEEPGSEQLYVVAGVDRVIIHRDLPQRVVTYGEEVARSADRATFDVSLWDAEGSCVAELHGVRLRRVPAVSQPDHAWLDTCCYQLGWKLSETSEPRGQPSPRSWLVIDPTDRLQRLFRADGSTSDRMVGSYPAIDRIDARTLAVADGVLLHVAPENPVDVLRDATDALGLVQQVGAAAASRGHRAELVLVTGDALTVCPTDRGHGWLAGWVVGFRRTVANEVDSLSARHIDHDGDDDQVLRDAILSSDADELALRRGRRYRPTIERRRAAQRDRAWWASATEQRAGTADSFRLLATDTTLDGLRWATARRRSPGDGEVELRVDAVGLNYKDIAKLFGLVDPGSLERTFIGAGLGMEQCAVVERVGSGVDGYRVGQRFLASLPSGFGRHATLSIDDLRAVPAPTAWSSVQCAGQLVALATAHECIVEHGRLQPGEVVLIHGAAGGVGLAAIEVALSHHGTVFATAGTDEKRAMLRRLGATETFDSRSLNFVAEVLHATEGRGADVVLNTLPADGLRASIEAAAEGGRVIEIGKREILENGSLPLGLFDKNLTLVAFDLDQIASDAERFKAVATRVMEQVEARGYRPVPVTRFPAAAARDAFELLARSGHTGKLVIDLTDADDVACQEPPTRAGPIRSDRCYLITGGTGGVGLQAAQWLAHRGARSLVLISRRGALDRAGRAIVSPLRHQGVEVDVRALDVADEPGLRSLLDERRALGPPLGGVIHCAGISHDLPLAVMTPEDLRVVMEPKVLGAFVLDEVTREDPLDIFLLASSVSSLAGTSGQSAYAAANAVLDSFACWRRRQGRPAVSVQLGPVAEVGMAAKGEDIERYVHALGFDPLDLSRLESCLDRSIDWNQPTLGIFDIRWLDWAMAEPRAAAGHRFAELIDRAHDQTDDSVGVAWSRISSLAPPQRLVALADLVAEALAVVLGEAATKPELDGSLAALGLDSLMLVELQTRLNHALGAELSLMGLLESETVRDIARGLHQRLTVT